MRSRRRPSRWCDSSCTTVKSCLSSAPSPTSRSAARSEYTHTSSALKHPHLALLTFLSLPQGSQHHLSGKLADLQVHRWDHEAGGDALPARHAQTHHRWSESVSVSSPKGWALYQVCTIYTILPKVLAPLLMNRFDYFSNFYEYKS